MENAAITPPSRTQTAVTGTLHGGKKKRRNRTRRRRFLLSSALLIFVCDEQSRLDGYRILSEDKRKERTTDDVELLQSNRPCFS